jgi:hypothetical protein
VVEKQATESEAQPPASTQAVKQPEAIKLAVLPAPPPDAAPSRKAPVTADTSIAFAPSEGFAAAVPLSAAPSAMVPPGTERVSGIASGIEAGRAPVAPAQAASRSEGKAAMAPAAVGKAQASTAGDTKQRVSESSQAAGAGQRAANGDAQEPSATPVKAAPSVFGDAVAALAPTVPAAAGPSADKASPADPGNSAAQSAADADGLAVDVTAAQPGSSINVARVVESLHGSEMHVGMRTEEFGSISVTTSVNREQIATQISFDHGDLGRLLATHIQGMQEKLGSDTGLHATVEVLDRGASFTSGGGQQAGSFSQQAGGSGSGESGARQPSSASGAGFPPDSQAGAFAHPPGDEAEPANSSRLDVRG